MTLKVLLPGRISDGPEDSFEFTGEWYVDPLGNLMLRVRVRTGWRCEDGFEEQDVPRTFLRWRWNKVRREYEVRLVPIWRYEWVSEVGFVDTFVCETKRFTVTPGTVEKK